MLKSQKIKNLIIFLLPSHRAYSVILPVYIEKSNLVFCDDALHCGAYALVVVLTRPAHQARAAGALEIISVATLVQNLHLSACGSGPARPFFELFLGKRVAPAVFGEVSFDPDRVCVAAFFIAKVGFFAGEVFYCEEVEVFKEFRPEMRGDLENCFFGLRIILFSI